MQDLVKQCKRSSEFFFFFFFFFFLMYILRVPFSNKSDGLDSAILSELVHFFKLISEMVHL